MHRTAEQTRALLIKLRNESERASYRVAERYRRDGDALGFVCEAHQELPAQPPPDRRTLVLFAHFDLQGVVDPYVVYYLKALHGLRNLSTCLRHRSAEFTEQPPRCLVG